MAEKNNDKNTKKEEDEQPKMAETKYGKYVISELKLASKLSPPRQGPDPYHIPKPGEGGRIQPLDLENKKDVTEIWLGKGNEAN